MEETRRRRGREYREERQRARKARRRKFTACLLLCLCCFLAGGAAGWYARGRGSRQTVDPETVEIPPWIRQELLTMNPYSRPGTRIGPVRGIVVHYVANPGTSAESNRNYFEGLKDQTGDNKRSVSSHFIVGLEGEILQCVPIGEIAYASNQRNEDTVSIECCHPDLTGEFTPETYASLVKLTAWLCRELNLEPGDVIRHYDVNGKDCPKYFVDYPEQWEVFLKDVKRERKSGAHSD